MSKRLENAAKLEKAAMWIIRATLFVVLILFIKGAFVAAGVGMIFAYLVNKVRISYENKIDHYLAIGEGRPVVMNPRTIMPQERTK